MGIIITLHYLVLESKDLVQMISSIIAIGLLLEWKDWTMEKSKRLDDVEMSIKGKATKRKKKPTQPQVQQTNSILMNVGSNSCDP